MSEHTSRQSKPRPGIKILSLRHLLEKLKNGKVRFAVIDFETNGLEQGSSVLAWTGIFGSVVGIPPVWMEAEAITRYYLPLEPVDRTAGRHHGLNETRIQALRNDADYPEHFVEDLDAARRLSEVELIVSHNAVFDASFVPSAATTLFFCTMRANVTRVGRRPDGALQFPSLADTSAHYRLSYGQSELHTSEGDARLAAKVFHAMIERAAAARYDPRKRRSLDDSGPTRPHGEAT